MFRGILNSAIVLTLGTFSSCEIENQAPTTFEVTVEKVGPLVTKISWQESFDPEGEGVTYDLAIEDKSIRNDTRDRIHTIEGLEADKKYSGKVIAKDNNGNRTIIDFSFSTESITLPVFVTDFMSMSVKSDELSAWVNWTPLETEHALYDISLNGAVVGENVEGAKFKISGLSPATTYIVVVTTTLYEQTFEHALEFVTPTAPGEFSIHQEYLGVTKAFYTWDRSTAVDGSPVVYDVYFGSSHQPQPRIKTDISDTSMLIDLPLNGGGHRLHVRAKATNGLIRQKEIYMAPRAVFDLSENPPTIDLYNVSDNSAFISGKIFGEIKPKSIDSIKYLAFLNDAVVPLDLCEADYTTSFGGKLNLQPGTSYSLKIVVDNSDYVDPTYETISNKAETIFNFVTPAIPLTDNLVLNIVDIEQHAATVLLNQNIHGSYCDPHGQYDYYDIYLDDNFITKVDPLKFDQKYRLTNLTPGTSYHLRVVHTYKFGTRVQSRQEATTVFSTTP